MIGRACRKFLCIVASYYMADAYMHLGVPRLHSTVDCIFVYKFFGGELLWYIGMKGSFIRLSKLVGFVILFIRFKSDESGALCMRFNGWFQRWI